MGDGIENPFLTQFSVSDRVVYLSKTEYMNYDDAMSVRVFALDATIKLLQSSQSTNETKRSMMALRVLFDEVDCQFANDQYDVFLQDVRLLFSTIPFTGAEPWLKKRLTLSSFVVLRDIVNDI